MSTISAITITAPVATTSADQSAAPIVEISADFPVMTVDENGTKSWKLNGLLHRLDGPAEITASGKQTWAQHGLPVREDNLPHVVDGGLLEWYHADTPDNWVLHNLYGPARTKSDGTVEYYHKNKTKKLRLLGRWLHSIEK